MDLLLSDQTGGGGLIVNRFKKLLASFITHFTPIDYCCNYKGRLYLNTAYGLTHCIDSNMTLSITTPSIVTFSITVN